MTWRLVAGGAVLLGGDPGIGKSTLLLQALGGVANGGHEVVYVSGEEGIDQIRGRAERLGLAKAAVGLATATSADAAAATIKANEDCTLWKLDRDTFNNIVKDGSSKKREKYEMFLDKVPVFSTMEPYERSKLADAFKEVSIKAGEFIIREGEPGNDLFLLQEGEAVATKTLKEGEEPTQVMEYKMCDYFGERALIQNEPRAANVVAKTNCVLVSMDRHSVKRLLGPLEELLKRNFEIYEKYSSK